MTANSPLPDLSGLKPCPFCGCDAWIIEDRGDHGTEPLLYRAQCKMCGASRGGSTYRDNAILAWNRRAPDEALIAKVEALEGKEEESARAESVCAHPIASEPPLSAGDDAPTMQELRDSREWLSDLLTSVLNNDSRAEAVALLAYREFAK